MDKEKQRIKISEVCGWVNHDHPDVMKLKEGWIMPEVWCMNPKGELASNHSRPDYLNDLNAMHEAKKLLSDEQWEIYAGHLAKFHQPLNSFKFLNATAEQEAEAFLRTL